MQSGNLDAQAIYQAVSDYCEGWYQPNVERIAGCLHDGLAKRTIERDDDSKEYLFHLTKDMLVEMTRKGGGSNAPAEKKNWTITILDCYERIATVKLNCPEYVEYMHLAKQEGRWQILNILWMYNHQQG